MAKRGKIVVIEGTDCSGKETQTNLLISRLRTEGISCETMSFPKYDTPTGRVVGQCYLGKPEMGKSWFEDVNAVDPLIASLYYAADRRAALPEIQKILDSGAHLILNRYVESNMGHQGGKERNFSKRVELFGKIETLEYSILGLPRPNQVIFLFMPYQIGMELKKGRPGKADGHEASIEHLQNAEEAYLHLAQMFKWKTINCAPNNQFPPRTIENIAEEVYRETLPALSN